MTAELSLIIVFNDAVLGPRRFDHSLRENLLRDRMTWIHQLAPAVSLGQPNPSGMSVTARATHAPLADLIETIEHHQDVRDLIFDGPMIRAALHPVSTASQPGND